MLQIELSNELELISRNLDDSWEQDTLKTLPLPIAYPLHRLRTKQYPWDLLVNDMINSLLKYIAMGAICDYLYSDDEVDFNLNDALKKLALPMSTGDWLNIIRCCSRRNGKHFLHVLPKLFKKIEYGPLKVRLNFQKYGLCTNNLGVFSSLVTIRNKLFAHGTTLSDTEKTLSTPFVLNLVRASIYLTLPLWRYRLIMPTFFKRENNALLLHSYNEFASLYLPSITNVQSCYLYHKKEKNMPLFPIVVTSLDSEEESVSIDFKSIGFHMLDQIRRTRIPIYFQLGGGPTPRPEYEGVLLSEFKKKKIWEKRRDIEIDQVLAFARDNLEKVLLESQRNNLYKPEFFVERQLYSKCIQSFFRDKTARALIIFGNPGSGKTTFVIDLISRIEEIEGSGVLVRAVKLPTRVVKPKQFSLWLCDELGYAGSFAQVLERCKTHGSGIFLLVIDGINEFTNPRRDASLLFRAINYFLAEHESSVALKVIITARSELLHTFLPGGSLPCDSDETLYFQPSGQHYIEIGPVTEVEAYQMFKKYNISQNEIYKYLSYGSNLILNPLNLRKAALGAIRPHDLKHLDEEGLTKVFLQNRLGEDKYLRKNVELLVQVMGKSRDMVITEANLLKTAPKLLDALQANGNRMLTILQELEIIQIISMDDEQGYPTWAIAIANDTLFEVLLADQKKKTLMHVFLFSFIPFIFSLVITASVYFVTSNTAYNKINEIEAIAQEYETEKFQSDNDKIQYAFINTLPNVGNIGLNIIFMLVFRLLIFLFLFSLIILACLFYFQFRYIVKDKREPRLTYFGYSYFHKFFKPLYYWVFSISFLASIAMAFDLFASTNLALHICFIAIVLIMAIQCLMTHSSLRNLSSPLLKEFAFSPYALKKNSLALGLVLLLFSLFFVFMFAVSYTPLSFFVPPEHFSKARKQIQSDYEKLLYELNVGHQVISEDQTIMNLVHPIEELENNALPKLISSIRDFIDWAFFLCSLIVAWSLTNYSIILYNAKKSIKNNSKLI